MSAPWLAGAGGLAIIAVGVVLGLDALKAIGVLVAFVGGALYVAVQVRAAVRSPERRPIESETGSGDDYQAPPGQSESSRRH